MSGSRLTDRSALPVVRPQEKQARAPLLPHTRARGVRQASPGAGEPAAAPGPFPLRRQGARTAAPAGPRAIAALPARTSAKGFI